jgi:VanZ family protein
LTTYRGLFALSVLLILVATTVPWDVRLPPDFGDPDEWLPVWDPEDGEFRSVPDMIQNVLLFLPFGFLGWLALRSVRTVVLLGFALSLGVELVQTLLESRIAATTDLCMNVLGTLLGARTARRHAVALEQRVFPRMRELVAHRPGLLPLGALAVGVASRALAPFHATLDHRSLLEQLEAFANDPWGSRPWPALVFDALLFAGLAVIWLRETPWRRSLWLLAPALEFARFFIRGDQPSLLDLACAWAGTAVGFAIAARMDPGPAEKPGELSRGHPALCYAFAIALIVVRAMAPFRFDAWSAPDARGFVPFATLLANFTRDTVANVFTVVAVYAPLAHVLLMRGARVGATVATCVVIALLLEVFQIPLAGRTFDVTEGLLAAAAALVVARATRPAGARS